MYFDFDKSLRTIGFSGEFLSYGSISFIENPVVLLK